MSSPERKVVAMNRDGLLVNGNNNGYIKFEMLDAQTKASLEKISRDAPALGKLLIKSLEDGFISPDTADALARAAHNINADVADALIYAGSRINHDVADSLSHSSQGINEGVAASIQVAAQRLGEEREELERTLNAIKCAVSDFSGIEYSGNSAGSASYEIVEANYPWTKKFRLGVIGFCLACVLLAVPLWILVSTR